ncbi:UDP-glucose 4-epimerase GalE [Actinoplanes sp. NPDC049599]|uniref:UDP-glucose 4-epimerase GalE n=1 Tax=Actinoplanes sp. NPDC049599 TaxID=3363903 RepID=UPI00379E0E3F
MKVLIAGGAGYIGSTVASACVDQNIIPIILDNLSTGRSEFVKDRDFYFGDIGDPQAVERVFRDHPDIDVALHAAALIAVPESVSRPMEYYRENVTKTLVFVESLIANGCHRLIFSSSAALYRAATDGTVDETSDVEPLSPYARTKAVVEMMLQDIAHTQAIRVLSLRYFNPIGADPKMRSGPHLRHPSHVLGKLIEAHQRGEPFTVTGDDYATRDGSAIRDYIHVWDLATAHTAAVRNYDRAVPDAGGYSVINLGTGDGTTVKELVKAFERVTRQPVNVVVGPRRAGDNGGAFTRIDRAARMLQWRPKRSLADGVEDSLKWFECRSQMLPDLA